MIAIRRVDRGAPQARLADPRLTRDGERTAARVKQRPDRREVGVTADELVHGLHGNRCAGSYELLVVVASERLVGVVEELEDPFLLALLELLLLLQLLEVELGVRRPALAHAGRVASGGRP